MDLGTRRDEEGQRALPAAGQRGVQEAHAGEITPVQIFNGNDERFPRHVLEPDLPAGRDGVLHDLGIGAGHPKSLGCLGGGYRCSTDLAQQLDVVGATGVHAEARKMLVELVLQREVGSTPGPRDS